jgi:hypothetical protein
MALRLSAPDTRAGLQTSSQLGPQADRRTRDRGWPLTIGPRSVNVTVGKKA